MNNQRQKILATFEKETADHCMTVLLDNGVHRHLRFAKPSSSAYSFDIITWPGNLAITGDMGASMFCRTHDMFEFFRGNDDYPTLHINPGYWAEKLTANDGDTKEFDEASFKAMVKDYFKDFVDCHLADDPCRSQLASGLWEAIQRAVFDDSINSVEAAGCKLEQFSHTVADKQFSFTDWWDRATAMQTYRHHFIWRLYAIVYAVRCYDAHRQAAEQKTIADSREDGLYAVHYYCSIDRMTKYLLAHKNGNVWRCNMQYQFMKYQGDKIINAWLLAADKQQGAING